MLAEDETLFVEHKTGWGGNHEQVSRAAASFANTLGGWLLVGVTNGKLNEGKPDGWQPPSGPWVDHVRQAFEGNLDPVPPFAAAVRQIGADGERVGVIRIYESADTPHIFGTGAVYVREVAQDRKVKKGYDRYVPTAVRHQQQLIELLARGDNARERIERLLGPPSRMDHLDSALGLSWERLSEHGWHLKGQGARLILRVVPFTPTPRFADWAVSQDAGEACVKLLREAGGISKATEPMQPHASGLAAIGRGGTRPVLSDLPQLTVASAVAATDSAGVIGVRVIYSVPPNFDKPNMTLNGCRRGLFEPTLSALIAVLEEAEFHGRAICHAWVAGLNDVLLVDHDGEQKPGAVQLPLAGEISVPGLTSDGRLGPELAALARRWTEEFARACGHLVYFGEAPAD